MGNRKDLQFIEEVNFAFQQFFLTNGFKCVSNGPTFVRYESDRVFVNIYHGRSSYEIGAEIGLLETPGLSYPISWLIKIADTEEGENYKQFVATTPELVRKGIIQLRNIFDKYVVVALDGNSGVFKRIEKEINDWKSLYAMEVLASQVRPKAEEAFRNKNYTEVINLYTSIEVLLIPSERKKLEYARKKEKQK